MAQENAQSGKAADKAKKKKVGPLTFFRQVRAEGAKVTWTSRSETIAATIMVVIMTILAALFLLLADWIVGTLVEMIAGI